jgi:mRNA interferase MazF
VHFTDTFEIKKRPVLILFEEFDNVVVAGITSNLNMTGVALTKKDGAIKNSVIKLNYIFTISSVMAEKKLFSLSKQKKKEVHTRLVNKLKNIL